MNNKAGAWGEKGKEIESCKVWKVKNGIHIGFDKETKIKGTFDNPD